MIWALKNSWTKPKPSNLPLPEKGAYFVTIKADDGETQLTASGVIVRSEIELEVQEDAASGRVRVNVAKFTPDDKNGPPLSKAEVWVIGSANDSFRKSQTDLRGVMMADDVRGKPTIIAYKDGDYAFYRSEKILQPQLVTPPPASRPANQPAKPSEAKSFKDQARDVYLYNNDIVQQEQLGNYRALQGKNAKGEAQAAPADLGVAAGKAF